MPRQKALVLAVCAVLACSGLASQNSPSPQAAASALTNKDIRELLKAGLTQEIVIAKIKSSTCDFDTSPGELKELKAANVPDSVILAMVQTANKQRETSAQRPTVPIDNAKIAESSVSTRTPAPVGVGYVDCGKLQEVPVHLTPIVGSTYVVARLKCGDQVRVIDQGSSWTKIRTKDNLEGYVSHEFISAQIPKPIPPTTQKKSAAAVRPSTVTPAAFGQAQAPASSKPFCLFLSDEDCAKAQKSKEPNCLFFDEACWRNAQWNPARSLAPKVVLPPKVSQSPTQGDKKYVPTAPPSQRVRARGDSDCSPAIEDTIRGEFEGWDGETIFKLDNGQIWQQAEYDYMYSYQYRPDVTIYLTSSGCRMKVEDESETILVRRIK